jgi:hypothetical protein
MKPAVPREVVDAGGGFEENHRRARGVRRATRHDMRHARNFDIVETADESAFEALREEIRNFGEH